MKSKQVGQELIWILLISILTIIPFLGLQEYNTKGEPREAIVAYSMLHENNWILPTNNGGDIAYKPPLFHWCIVAVSSVTGEVTEFTSRFPSAIALIVMVACGFVFYARRKNKEVALVAALLTLTAFEVHRAGFACRVDMLLTAFVVGALYLFYKWIEKDCKGIPLGAILCMSAATLTKGPVGIILPCFVIGVFLLLRGIYRFKPYLLLFVFAILACIIPACWYIAAYKEAGQAFINLIMDENFRRFTGKMSYDSHVNPFYYNFFTLIAGWLPWTLFVVVSLFFLKWKSASKSFTRPGSWFSSILMKARHADPVQLFTWLSFLLILFFYCIPKSKRSVYLLPAYPFMAVLIAEYLIYMWKVSVKPFRISGIFFGILAILLPILFICIKCGSVPTTIFHGKHAWESILLIQGLENIHLSFLNLFFIFLPLVIGVYTVVQIGKRRNASFVALFACIFSLYLTLDAVYLPAMLNTKSDKPFAEYIEKNVTKGNVYSYLSSDMLRFFMTDFYMGDKVRLFERDLPQEGWLIVGDKDKNEFFRKAYTKNYRFTPMMHTVRPRADVGQVVRFYKFVRLKAINSGVPR